MRSQPAERRLECAIQFDGPPAYRTRRRSPSQIHRRFMRIPLAPLIAWVVAQVITAGLALGQVLTHGPVVGGVTASDANVFVRTGNVATVEVHYGTDPNLSTYSTSQAFSTDPASDFAK